MTSDERAAVIAETDEDIPVDVRQELMRCASENGRISYWYLCDLWRRGHDHGYSEGYAVGLDENQGDPRVGQIEAGFRAIQEATGGEYSVEDHSIIAALQAGREFAVRLANREIHIAQLIEESGELQRLLAVAAPEFCSNRCPSVFSKPYHRQPRHVPNCDAMRALLSSSPRPETTTEQDTRVDGQR